MGKGRTYELDMVRNINAVCDPRWVHAAVPDHSGNAADTFYDLEVSYSLGYDGHAMHMIELKKRTGDEGKRTIVMSGGNDGETGLEELRRLIDGCTNWQTPWVHIKFDHREAIVLHAEDLHVALTGDTWRTYGDLSLNRNGTPTWLANIGPRLTDADSISMRKPELDWWPSSHSGRDDHIKLLESFPNWREHRYHDGDENARVLNNMEDN
jgi:hypothetical protein